MEANLKKDERIVLAHGGGGDLTARLLMERIIPRLGNDLLNPLADSAVFTVGEGRMCLTTDAFVVQPLEFPGGDIGRLSVCGTVNDLAVMGAVPKYLSLALVLEEGLPFGVLDRIVESIALSAKEAGVVIATGDTKVIENRSGGYGMIITTAGVGVLRSDDRMETGRIEPGDVILINGGIAEHGLAVLSAREGISFSTEVRSDAAPLNGLIGRILDTGAEVKFMRDPTRGGLAGVLADLAERTGWSIEVDEAAIPIQVAVRHGCEMLGLDPLTVANEGKCVIVVAAKDAEKVMAACKGDPLGSTAAVIGRFTTEKPALVELVTRAGGRRMVQRPYGEELPRIC